MLAVAADTGCRRDRRQRRRDGRRRRSGPWQPAPSGLEVADDVGDERVDLCLDGVRIVAGRHTAPSAWRRPFSPLASSFVEAPLRRLGGAIELALSLSQGTQRRPRRPLPRALARADRERARLGGGALGRLPAAHLLAAAVVSRSATRSAIVTHPTFASSAAVAVRRADTTASGSRRGFFTLWPRACSKQLRAWSAFELGLGFLVAHTASTVVDP